jgi:hypothetical protein
MASVLSSWSGKAVGGGRLYTTAELEALHTHLVLKFRSMAAQHSPGCAFVAPYLPTLPMAMTASVVGPQLPQLSPALTPIQRRALSRRCRVALLRYRPGKRATVRLGAPLANANYVAKVYHDPGKAAAVAHEAQALARTADRNGLLRLAPTIGHLPEISVVVQQSIHGQPLDSLLLTPGVPGAASAAVVRRAASALAQLHRGAMVSTRLRPVGKELHRFMARALRISEVESNLGAQLTDLAERLLQTFSAFPVSPLGLVHGDCKPGQFLLTKDGAVYLLGLRPLRSLRPDRRCGHLRRIVATARGAADRGRRITGFDGRF